MVVLYSIHQRAFNIHLMLEDLGKLTHSSSREQSRCLGLVALRQWDNDHILEAGICDNSLAVVAVRTLCYFLQC